MSLLGVCVAVMVVGLVAVGVIWAVGAAVDGKLENKVLVTWAAGEPFCAFAEQERNEVPPIEQRIARLEQGAF